MTVHKIHRVYLERPRVTITTTLCRRANPGSLDETNSTENDDEVTCKACSRIIDGKYVSDRRSRRDED